MPSFQRVNEFLDRLAARSKLFVICLALLLTAAVGTIDYLGGYQMRFSLFYLIPVMLVAWYLGPLAGIVASFLCSMVGTAANAGHPVPDEMVPVWNYFATMSFYVTTVLILTELQSALTREQLLARRDPLTGVANRREFMELAVRELERSQRYQHRLTVAYISCDSWNQVNQQYGRQAGDEMLRTVSRVLVSYLKAPDMVARLDGDEFAVLFPETDEKEAREVLVRILAQLEEADHESEWPISCRIAVKSFSEPPESVEALLLRPDGPLYQTRPVDL